MKSVLQTVKQTITHYQADGLKLDYIQLNEEAYSNIRKEVEEIAGVEVMKIAIAGVTIVKIDTPAEYYGGTRYYKLIFSKEGAI